MAAEADEMPWIRNKKLSWKLKKTIQVRRISGSISRFLEQL